jgi:VWFA-related protein
MHVQFRSLAALGVLLAAVGVSGSAQQAPQPAAPQPTFRANVTLVTTDVIPRTDKGLFVSDLTQDDFTVLEDGVPQKITSFSLIHGGRTFNLFEAAAAPAPEGIVLPPTRRRVEDTAGRVLLVIVDDLHFEPEYTPHVRRLVQTLADNLIHEGDLVAVMSTGPSYIEIGPTYDRKAVLEAVGKIRGTGLTAKEIFSSLDTTQGPGDVRNRARTAFFSVYNMLGQLESVSNKRKAVIYISQGYDFDPFAEGRASSDHIQGGRFADPLRELVDTENPYYRIGAITADIDLHRLLKELTLSANRANAAIYAVDPRGLAGIVDAGQYIDQSEWRTYLQKTQSTLRYVSEETGGFSVVNTNDFATEFKRIDAETSDYYVLGFYSSNPDPLKRTRTLEVSVTRPNIVVASRKAYSLKTEGKPPAPPPLKPKKK